MKNRHVVIILLLLSLLFLSQVVYAQAPPKKPAPQVPITYQGDTDKTIVRRAQWMEGAKKERELVWWGILQPELASKVIAEFNKMYPFITVSYWLANARAIATKLEAEFIGGRVTPDVSHGGGDENYPRWRKMGLMEKLTDVIPAIDKMDKRMYSRVGDWVQISHNLNMPAYNTKLVPAAEAPKNWEDLIQPKWQGQQIGVQAQMTPWITLALGEGGWGIEKTKDFLTKIREQQPVHTASYSSGLSLLAAGEFKMMPDNLLFLVLNAQAKGSPVEWVKASPLATTGPSLVLTTKAQHPNAGRLFVEWLSSRQGMQIYDGITGQGVAFSGWGTRQSKLAEGMNLVFRTEEVSIKSGELGLEQTFYDILGLTPDKK